MRQPGRFATRPGIAVSTSSRDGEVLGIVETEPSTEPTDAVELVEVGLDVVLLQRDAEVLPPVRKPQQQPDDCLELADDDQLRAGRQAPLEGASVWQLDCLAVAAVRLGPGVGLLEMLVALWNERLAAQCRLLLDLLDLRFFISVDFLDHLLEFNVLLGFQGSFFSCLRHRSCRYWLGLRQLIYLT